MKRIKKISIISLLFLLIMILTSCSDELDDHETDLPDGPWFAMQEKTQNVLDGLMEKDAEKIYNQMCTYYKTNFDKKQKMKEIQEMIDFLDGEIVQYDGPIALSGSAYHGDGPGYEYKNAGCHFEQIVTSTGYRYELDSTMNQVNKKHPDREDGLLGVSINRWDDDQYLFANTGSEIEEYE